MALLPDITAFYDDGDEAGRLTSGRTIGTIELMRTQEILRAHLPPPPASVLDVGGGPGVHARLLADSGYRVLVIDPVERHVRQARARGLAAEVGDARSLDRADRTKDLGARALESALAAARFADTRPDLLVTSLHLLAVAHRPRPAGPNG
ncbi:class I SAM-dependent methyltransferase [Kitasatospora purpeofusca]|uniref:class I SAM-dependent methyltransferase n=1 Tax=Kitasatospora purpeofusca TaxID=67352 RepID=UPI003864E266